MALGSTLHPASSSGCERLRPVPRLSLRCRKQPAHLLVAAAANERTWQLWTPHRRRRRPTAHIARAAAAAGSDSGSSSESSSAASAAVSAPTEAEVQRSQRLIQEQQQLLQESHTQPYDLAKTRRLVETAMLAAVAGLAYTLATLLKLEGYMGYFLPLPVIISALRSGAGAGFKTAATAFLLLFILMGPVRAMTYLLMYGALSLALGTCWAMRLPWSLCIPIAAAARVGGYLAYIKMASWVANEDLWALLITNVHSMLDQLSSTMGHSGAPSLLAVTITIASILAVNAVVYVGMMHVLYAILLRSMGLEMSAMPAAVQRFVYRGAMPGQQQQQGAA